MLVEQYPLDKRFEELAKHFPKREAALVKIDQYLEDEKQYRWIQADLSKRYPKTTETGRNSRPVEVGLRMLVGKGWYGYSDEDTVERVKDSLNLRRFCRVDLNEVPVDPTLLRWANLIQPKTLEKFNERIVQLAVERKVTSGRKLRSDGTVVASNIRAPSANRLLADGVRVLARTVMRARPLLKPTIQKPFEDFTQTAKPLARQSGETLRQKTDAAKSTGRQQSQELLEMTRKTVTWAQPTKKHLRNCCEAKAQRLAQTLETFLPRTAQVIDQTTRRILPGEQVPAQEKIVSLFEEHTDIIRRGKEARPVEYGHQVWLNDTCTARKCR